MDGESIRELMIVPVKQQPKRLRPDEISATDISSWLNRRRLSLTEHLTGQVGQAFYRVTLGCCEISRV